MAGQNSQNEYTKKQQPIDVVFFCCIFTLIYADHSIPYIQGRSCMEDHTRESSWSFKK